MRKHDQRCSTRKEDWTRFWTAIRLMDFLDILHTGKNIIVEELRRWRGKC